jgi:hypothetical protein
MKVEESPTDDILRDWPFLLKLAAWGSAVVVIIYLLLVPIPESGIPSATVFEPWIAIAS